MGYERSSAEHLWFFAERAIRTLKDQIRVRQDALGDKDWTEYLPDVLEQYNSTERVTTKMTPEEAQKQSNAEEVRESIESKAKFNRKYPKLDVGDRVRIRLKAGGSVSTKAARAAGAKRRTPLLRRSFSTDRHSTNSPEGRVSSCAMSYKGSMARLC